VYLFHTGTPGTYLEKAQAGLPTTTRLLFAPVPLTEEEYLGAALGTALSAEICPYAAHGECPFSDRCTYTHGDICELCGLAALSPFDRQQRHKHTEVSQTGWDCFRSVSIVGDIGLMFILVRILRDINVL